MKQPDDSTVRTDQIKVFSISTHVVVVVWYEPIWLAPHVVLLPVSHHLLLSPPPLLLVPEDMGTTSQTDQFQ